MPLIDSGDGNAQFSWAPTQPGKFGAALLPTDDGSLLAYNEETIMTFVTTGNLCDEPLNPDDIDCAMDIDDLNITLGSYRLRRGHFNIALHNISFIHVY